MGLRARLLARQAEAGNSGNSGNTAAVTEKAVIEQGGNSGNSGNSDFEGGGAEEATPGAVEAEKLTRATSYKTVTTVTSVTSLKTKGKSGNSPAVELLPAVTGQEQGSSADHPDQVDPGDWQGEYEPARTRSVRYRRFGDTIMWPHRSASVPAALPNLFAAAAWLDDEGYGPVSVIEAVPA